MIAIISAMQEELQHVLEAMQGVKNFDIGKRRFYSGTLFGKEVVLVFSRWGKVAAATTVTQLINSFPVERIIFSGVAGSVKNQVNIGDVVVGTSLVQHDMDASPLFAVTEIPLLGVSVFKNPKDENLVEAVEGFIQKYDSFFDDDLQAEFGIKNPKWFQGKIASGDVFVKYKTQIDNVLQHHPDVLCVEMEGAAVAQVCYEYGITFQIIRIISDKANDNAHIDFPLFAQKVAGKYALHILEHYFKLWFTTGVVENN